MKRLLPAALTLGLALSLCAPVLAADAKGGDKPAAAPVDSLALLEKTVARDSTKFDNLTRLGVLYLDRDRFAEAQKVLMKAHLMKPKDLKTIVNLGAAYDAANEPFAAQQYYKAALAMAPGDSVAACRLASSYYAQGSYTEAVNTLREILKTKPRSHCAYFTMGVAFADAGIYADAIRMWKKVVELAPDSPEAASARESIDVLEKYLKGPAAQ